MPRLWGKVIGIADFTSALCVVAMVGVVAMQIFLRYVLGHPFVWADELATWLFVWVIYLGASVLVRYDGHLSVDIVTARLSAPVNRWRRLFVNVPILAFLILLLVQTVGLLQKFGLTPSPAMHVPMAFYFGSAMVFGTIALIEYIRQTVCLVLVLCGKMTEVVVRGPDGRDVRTSVKL